MLLAMIALMSCQDQVGQLSGTYSYKISGSAVQDSVSVALPNEQGAMELVRISADSALLTFNALAGPVYSTRAAIKGTQISLNPYSRVLEVGVEDYNVTASGEGTVYDKTILMQMKYVTVDSVLMADSLTMVCKKN